MSQTKILQYLEPVYLWIHCFYCRHYFKPEADEAAGQRVPYAPALAIGWIWACSLNQEIYVVYLQWLNLAGLGGAQ